MVCVCVWGGGGGGGVGGSNDHGEGCNEQLPEYLSNHLMCV